MYIAIPLQSHIHINRKRVGGFCYRAEAFAKRQTFHNSILQMTREEEIKISALDYVRLSHRICPDEQSFFDGAEWADKHPQSPWISVKDRLPTKGGITYVWTRTTT